MKTNKYIGIFLAGYLVVLLGSCNEGYLTPVHVAPVVVNGAATITNETGEVNTLYINDLLINTGVPPGQSGLGVTGLTRNLKTFVPVANDQTFKLTLKTGTTIHLDTTITVTRSGLDSYIVYKKTSSGSNYSLYRMNTVLQDEPAKGMTRVRFVNALPQQAGDGSLSINFSRKQNININNGKPLKFGEETSYIDIPYGTYQPLVTDALGKPVFSRLPNDLSVDVTQWPQIELKPGGVYSFILTQGYNDGERSNFGYFVPTTLVEEKLYSQDPMGKLKFVHVDPLIADVTIRIDGQVIQTTPLSYFNDYNPVVVDEGVHTIKIFDTFGRKIVEKKITIIDSDQQVAFLIHGKRGLPDLELFDIISVADDQFAAGNTAAAFFNFSPDSPVVSFVGQRPFNGAIVYSMFTQDSLAVNLPYLKMPRLKGISAAPVIYSGPNLLFTLRSAVPYGFALAFDVQNATINPNKVAPGSIVDRPFFEYPAFANNSNTKDVGYFLVIAAGLQYAPLPERSLKIKVIKYVE